MDNDIKKHICRKRNELHLTQNEVANKVGISLTAYRELESGKTQMLNSKIEKIANAFEMSTEELVLGYEPNPEGSKRLEELRFRHESQLEEQRSRYEEIISRLNDKISDLERLIRTLEATISDKNEIIEFQRKNIAGQN